MNLPKYFLLGVLWTSAMGPVAAAAQTAPDAWSRVDALAPGTQIAVTLAADEERVGAFVAATSEILTIRSDSPAAGDVSLSKSGVRRVVRVMPRHRLLKNGAWTGAFVMGAFPLMTARACGKGCEMGGNAGLFLLVGTALGAGVGGALGHFAEEYGADDRVLFPMVEASNRFYPSRPTGRLGVAVHRMTLQSNLVKGAALGQAYSVVWQASPFVSARVEYARMSDGFEGRRIRYTFSELIGVHPKPLGRFRVEFLAGLAMHATDDRDFQTPKIATVLGLDGEVAIVPGITLVPTFRYTRSGDLGGTRSFGIGANWRF